MVVTHTSKDDYLTNTLRFVSRKEASQIYGVVLPECLTSTEMKQSKAYKTYLGYATGEVPPKVARKFKKASPSKKKSELVLGEEEPVKKGKRLKTSAKKSASKPATGIKLLSEVALSEKAQMKEARMKSLRDFHKTHPSGSGTVAEKPPSVEKITPTVISEGTDDSNNEQESSDESSNQENENEEQELDSEQDKESDDDDQEEEEFDQENESEDDEMKSDEEQGMDDTTDQFDDDADARLEEPTETATRIDTTTPPPTIETTNPLSNLLDFSSVFRFNDRITALEKEVADLKKDPLHTQVTSLVDIKDHLPQILPQEVSNFAPPVIEKLIKESRDEVTLAKVSSQPQSTYEVASTLTEFELKKILLDKMEKSESYLTTPEHRDCYDGLKKSYALDKDFLYSYDVYLLKHGRKDKDKDEDPFAGSDRGLKKRKTSKDVEPTTGPKKKDSTSDSSKGTKSQPKSIEKSVQSEEPVFEDETASRRDWFKKPTPPQEPTDPDWNVGKTTKEGPTQTWLMNLAASNPIEIVKGL
ncbi:hypothetical protein Tco_0318700 [Tanacetum coccineum]